MERGEHAGDIPRIERKTAVNTLKKNPWLFGNFCRLPVYPSAKRQSPVSFWSINLLDIMESLLSLKKAFFYYSAMHGSFGNGCLKSSTLYSSNFCFGVCKLHFVVFGTDRFWQRGQCTIHILFPVVLTPMPSSHHGSVWLLYVSSLHMHLTNTVRCWLAYPFDWRGFVGAKKKTKRGHLSIPNSWIAFDIIEVPCTCVHWPRPTKLQ